MSFFFLGYQPTFFVVICLFISLYEIHEYFRCLQETQYLHRIYSTIAYSEECLHPVVEVGTGLILEHHTLKIADVISNCTHALLQTHSGVLGPAFKKWFESRTFYKVTTMDNYVIKAMCIVVIIIILYNITDYYKHTYTIDRCALPLRYASSPPIGYRSLPQLKNRKKNKYNNNTPPQVEELDTPPPPPPMQPSFKPK